jgi:probable F420-dependent oxidoreductase
MKVSLTVSGFSRLFDNDLTRVLDVARTADELGIDQLAVADHVVMGDRVDRYPFGTFPYGPDEPWPEPLTLLTAIAAVTERVRLCTGILISPLRPPALLAKTVATLDQLSRGRVDLGVGTGWQREEYAACGLDWAQRWQLFDDGVRACRELWTEPPPATFTGATLSFGPTWCVPQPVQRAPRTRIPLWFGMAVTDEHARRIAQHAGGWLPIHTTTPDELRAGVDRLRAAYADVGLDPDSLPVRASAKVVFDGDRVVDTAATRDANAWLTDAGVTSASVGLGRHARDRDSLARFVEGCVDAFRAL